MTRLPGILSSSGETWVALPSQPGCGVNPSLFSSTTVLLTIPTCALSTVSHHQPHHHLTGFHIHDLARSHLPAVHRYIIFHSRSNPAASLRKAEVRKRDHDS